MIYKAFNITIIILLIIFPVSLSSQIISFEKRTDKVQQYNKTEFDIKLKETWNNPFWANEISLNMMVIAPSGKEQIVPCFFFKGESGQLSTWKCRYAPSESGAYKYSFELLKNKEVVSKTAIQSFNVDFSDNKGFLRLNNNWTFKFDNGELFRGVGENICWEARSNDDSKFFKELHEQAKYNYNYLLTQLADNGGNYFRTWMCSWNLPLEWKQVSSNTDRYKNSSEYFNPDGIKKMDEFVELCDSLGLYVMLAIDQSGNYRQWSWDRNNYNIKNGGFANTPYEFFTLEKPKEQYKNRLRYLIARWGYSTSIGAWEFFNEIDYLAFNDYEPIPKMQKAITDWHNEMAGFLKENDPYKHLVTTSVSHRDIEGLNQVKDIDFNQQHIYKRTSGMPEVIKKYIEDYKKPYVIGEYGYEWDWSLNFNDFAAEKDRDFKKGLWLGIFSPTPVLPMSWWWEFFEDRGLMSYFKSVRKMNDYILSFGNGEFKNVEVLTNSPESEIYGLRHGTKQFVYIHKDNFKDDNIKIEFKENINVKGKILLYDCEQATFYTIKDIKNGNHVLDVKFPQVVESEDLIIAFSTN